MLASWNPLGELKYCPRPLSCNMYYVGLLLRRRREGRGLFLRWSKGRKGEAKEKGLGKRE